MASERDKTIRELAGEVWAELRRLEGTDEYLGLVEQVVDVVMGVLARHTGSVIVNDPDWPVAPRR